jgi:hypothetical protein
MLGFNAPKPTGFNAPAPTSSSGFNAAPVAPAPPTFTEQLVNFCTQATLGRPPSHGVAHMNKVRVNALQIYDRLAASGTHTASMNPQFRKMVSAVAQFHDIADHKYVQDINSMGIEE